MTDARQPQSARRQKARRRQHVQQAAVAAAAVVILAAFIVLRPASEPFVGSAAPELELAGVDGEMVSLSDYLGRPVAITFMHSY